jgi:hypothetical protein
MLKPDALWQSPVHKIDAKFMFHEKDFLVTTIVVTMPLITINIADAHPMVPTPVAGVRLTAMVGRPQAQTIELMTTAHDTTQQTLNQQHCR